MRRAADGSCRDGAASEISRRRLHPDDPRSGGHGRRRVDHGGRFSQSVRPRRRRACLSSSWRRSSGAAGCGGKRSRQTAHHHCNSHYSSRRRSIDTPIGRGHHRHSKATARASVWGVHSHFTTHRWCTDWQWQRRRHRRQWQCSRAGDWQSATRAHVAASHRARRRAAGERDRESIRGTLRHGAPWLHREGTSAFFRDDPVDEQERNIDDGRLARRNICTPRDPTGS